VDVTFKTRDDDVIDLGSEWRGFTETLLDAVSTRPPRGSNDRCPSNYWIDRALAAVRDGQERDTGRPFLSGNGTELLLMKDGVVARALYETFDDEYISEEQLKQILADWRTRVTDAGSA
jgi:hypothetical protein